MFSRDFLGLISVGSGGVLSWAVFRFGSVFCFRVFFSRRGEFFVFWEFFFYLVRKYFFYFSVFIT